MWISNNESALQQWHATKKEHGSERWNERCNFPRLAITGSTGYRVPGRNATCTSTGGIRARTVRCKSVTGTRVPTRIRLRVKRVTVMSMNAREGLLAT